MPVNQLWWFSQWNWLSCLNELCQSKMIMLINLIMQIKSIKITMLIKPINIIIKIKPN